MIPAKLRHKLALKKNQKALVTEQNGKLIIEPVKDLLELGVSLKTHKKPLSSQEMHNFVAEAVAKTYAKKTT